jgi:tetratricopeptide (TPR) repeat protein
MQTEATLEMKSLKQGLVDPDGVEPELGTSPTKALQVASGQRPRVNWRRFLRAWVPWLALLLIALAAVGGGIIWVRADRAVQRDAQAVRAALASGRTAAARQALLRWLRARPSSAEAHALMAELALAEGDFGQVKPEYNKARDLGFPEDQLDRLRAIWLVRLGRFSEAEPTLARLWTETATPDPGVDEALARLYLKSYRLARAKAVIERWIQDAPSDGRPLLWLTEIDRRTEVDNPESWVQHYREALRRDPELDQARHGLAESLRKAHRNEEAAGEFAHYLSRHPDDPVALAGAGLNSLELGDLSKAAGLLDRALAVSPTNSAALKGRAEVDLQRGDQASAVRRLDQVIQADPFDDVALYARVQVKTLLGDKAGARADRETFDRLKKDQAELLALRSRLLDHPDDSETRSKVVTWMFAHGREQDGLDWAMAILANYPNHAPTCRILADYYAKRPDRAGLANFYRTKAESQASTQ